MNRRSFVQTRRRHTDEEARASFMELFFDLVFVLVVTQLTTLFSADVSWRGAAKLGFLLMVAWWAWVYTTWTTNWFDPDTFAVRVVLLIGMVASMLGAVSIPHAFGSRAVLLVAGYIALQVVRNSFVVVATGPTDPLYLPLVRFWRWNAAVGVLWIVGVFLDHDARIAIWAAALALDYVGPFLGHWTPGLGRSAAVEWKLVPSHFAERIYLFVIIALGESIVATGRTGAALELTASRTTAIVVALLLAAAFWWLYFDYHAQRAREELARAGDERGRLGRDLTYVHVPIIAGIVVAAVGSKIVTAHPHARLERHELAVLAAGPALYLIGGLLLKLRVLHVVAIQRLAATIAIGGVVALGARLPALAVWSLVLGVFTILAALETRERFRVTMQLPVGAS